MVVVPAFAVGEDGNPPEVAGCIASVVVAIAPKVGSRIHEPRAVVGGHHANAHTPDQPGEPELPASEQPAGGEEGDATAPEPERKRAFEEIHERSVNEFRAVATHQQASGLGGAFGEQPEHVGPPRGVFNG